MWDISSQLMLMSMVQTESAEQDKKSFFWDHNFAGFLAKMSNEICSNAKIFNKLMWKLQLLKWTVTYDKMP